MDLVIYLSLQLIIGLLLFTFGSTSTKKFLFLAAFLIPLQGLTFNLFVNFSWYKLIFPVGLIAHLVNKQTQFKLNGPAKISIIVFGGYVFVLTLFFYFLDLYNGNYSAIGSSLGWGPAQTTYRYPVQLVTFFFVWGIIIIGKLYVKDTEDIKALINGYINGNIFSICVGFYQVLAAQLGWPWFNLDFTSGFLSSNLVARASFFIGEFRFYRLFGFGGEPKHTVSYAIIAIVLIMALQFSSITRKMVKKTSEKLFILLVGIILTGSTGGWISLVFVLVYFFVVSIRYYRVLSKQNIYQIGFAICLSLFFLMILGPTLVQNLISSRITDRVSFSEENGFLDTLILQEPKDGALLFYALDHPANLIVGYGLGGIDAQIIPYVPDSFLSYGGTVTPAYLLPRLLGELGVVGIMMLIIIWYQCFSFLKKKKLLPFVLFLSAGGIGLLTATQVSLAAYLLLASAMINLGSTVFNVKTLNK